MEKYLTDRDMQDKKTIHEFLDLFHLIHPNLNDTFYYATADSERIVLDGHDDPEMNPTNQEVLVDVYIRFGFSGIVAYVGHIRKTIPIIPMQTDMYHDAKKYIDKLDWEYEAD